jgi:preprotein translocase subunit SecA
MEEGEHIEDKRITKGIIRAQKKVEERNFLARKHLLEYDEVMDHQRTTFYGLRQRVLEGRDVDDVIWEMIGDSITDAVEKYITQDYVAATIAEWARTNFGVTIEAEELRGLTRLADLEDYIKGQSRVEAEDKIIRGLAEYMGEEVTDDPADWDTGGLSSWAMSQFAVSLPKSQIKRMTAQEVEERLKEAALEQVDKKDVAGLEKYLEPLYAERSLAEWAKDKFSVTVSPQEMLVPNARDRQRKSAAEIAELIEARARDAYSRREVEYPVDHILTLVAGGEGSSTGSHLDNPYAAEYLRGWVRAKYGSDMALEHIRATPLRKLRDELIGLQEKALRDGKIDEDVDAMVHEAGGPEAKPEALAAAFKTRFGVALPVGELTGEARGRKTSRVSENGDGAVAAEDGAGTGGTPDVRRTLQSRARRFLRQELTDLEQFVLIQIFDQSWKDHLYAMDMLKGGVGLLGFAERDPRVVYKKEGYRYFEEMLAGVRDKVTDLIFKARVVGQARARSAYRETAAVHEDTGGYGVGENVRATADAVADPAAVTADAMQGSGGGDEEAAPVKVKQIVREAPKVGRNDPCPCGSGKKYKKCCGVNAE